VRAKTVARIGRLRVAIGIGCPACRDQPLVHLLGEHDRPPATRCASCERRFDDEVSVYLGIDPALV
jgi:transposase-like protein